MKLRATENPAAVYLIPVTGELIPGQLIIRGIYEPIPILLDIRGKLRKRSIFIGVQ